MRLSWVGLRTCRLSNRASKVLQLARQEAHRLGHTNIGPQHILLGIIREREGVASAVLADLGVSSQDLGREAEVLAGSATSKGDDRRDPFASSEGEVVKHALAEARNMNCSFAGSDHLLLGLLRLEISPTAQLLTSKGLTAGAVRDTIRRLRTPGKGPARRRAWLAGVVLVVIGLLALILVFARSSR
jgi:ATP-dependent Clp protease ATP-binding subunit ClpC